MPVLNSNKKTAVEYHLEFSDMPMIVISMLCTHASPVCFDIVVEVIMMCSFARYVCIVMWLNAEERMQTERRCVWDALVSVLAR